MHNHFRQSYVNTFYLFNTFTFPKFIPINPLYQILVLARIIRIVLNPSKEK